MVSTPREIAREWRLFVVQGQVVAGSRYRSYGQTDPVAELPVEVRAFAEAQLAVWNPLPAFAMDVCWVEDAREYKIVELGCMNSAGFYEADQVALTAAVSRLAEEMYSRDPAGPRATP